jgi:drug/metabolite transporter (DMT)-like permease
MLLSATGMSLIGLLTKAGLEDLTVSSLMFWRYTAAAALLFVPLCLLRKMGGFFNVKQIKIQVLRAFFVFSSQFCFFYYLEENNLLNASALLNTGPVFIALIEWGLLRKKVGLSSWLGAFVSMGGALLILQPDKSIFSFSSFLGLFSGASQGASQVVFGMQSKADEDSSMSLMHLFILCSFFSLASFLFFPSEMSFFRRCHSWDIWLILALGLASIGNQIFRAEAYKHGTPSRLSPYLYLSVVLAGIWDWIFFGHPPNYLAILGAALVVLGGILKIYLRAQILRRK